MSHLVVFTHQRWNFVRRRTQHLLGRMSSRFHVHVVETPVAHDGPPRLLRQRITAHLDVLVPLVPAVPGTTPGFDGDAMPVVRQLLAEHLADRGITSAPVAWTTTPRAEPLVTALNPRAVVYDCIDDGVEQGDADATLLAQEAALLRRADLVFAGGPSLYERKRSANPNVYCLPSAVDADRFAPHRLQPDSPEQRAAIALTRACRIPAWASTA